LIKGDTPDAPSCPEDVLLVAACVVGRQKPVAEGGCNAGVVVEGGVSDNDRALEAGVLIASVVCKLD
jgi:hypothetical protein